MAAPPPDPLVDAWLSCVEAAAAVCRAMSADDDEAAEQLRDAMSATRAATASLRFSLISHGDETRRRHHTQPS
ncbi:MAG: hypothetical protein HOV94_38670 [Saccharothrix sp.]|nr:hypothetical protein [Saccharothrix sp.]